MGKDDPSGEEGTTGAGAAGAGAGNALWDNSIPLGSCPQPTTPICTQFPNDPDNALDYEIAMADMLDPPQIQIKPAFVPNLPPVAPPTEVTTTVPGVWPPEDEWTFVDNPAANNYVIQSLGVKGQASNGPVGATKDQYACTLSGQVGSGSSASGTYNCTDTKSGITVTVTFSAKTVAGICSVSTSALPAEVWASGLSNDDNLKILNCH